MSRHLFLLFLAAVIFPLLAVAAPNDHVPITDQMCTLTGQADLSPAAVIDELASMDCSQDRFSKQTKYLWIAGKIDETASGLDASHLIVKASRQGNVRIFARFSDGSSFDQTYDSAAQAKNWHPLDAMAFEIDRQGRQIEHIVIGVDHPWDPGNWGDIELAQHLTDKDTHVYELVMIGLFCGLLFAPIFLNLVYSFIVENKFVVFHAVMMSCVISYALSWSGLIFELVPGLTMLDRSTFNHLVIPLGVLSASLLTRELCEPGTLNAFFSRFVVISGAIPLFIGAPFVLASPALPHIGSQIYHATFILPVFAIPATLIAARLRGSHMALVQMVAWSGLYFLVLTRILEGMAVIPDTALTTIGFFPVLVFEAAITTLAVSYRIILLRRERDEAMALQKQSSRKAETDFLTQIPNRRAFIDQFAIAKQTARRAEDGSALLLLDLDHFKLINDTHGHDAGDHVLRQFANLLKSSCRDGDVCARIGGEEFAVLMQAKDTRDALSFASRLCANTAALAYGFEGMSIGPVTASVGVVPIHWSDDRSFRDYYRQADAALYEAKNKGRNQVVLARPDMLSTKSPDTPDRTVAEAIEAFMVEDGSASDQRAS